jgi:serine/threonine-protein kinase
VVHRDLKPDNIFLAQDGEAGKYGYSVKLVDFGIAKLVQDEVETGAAATQAGVVVGTPHYMSPEALTSIVPVSAASDIWSLGACAFAAACGSVPFAGEAIGDVVLKVCAAPLPVPSKVEPSLPKAFDAWFQRCCARDVRTRFKSAAEAADALLRLDEWSRAEHDNVAYEFRPLQPSVGQWQHEAQPPASGHARLLAGVLVGVASTLGVLGFYVLQRTREADEIVRQNAARAAAATDAENARRLALPASSAPAPHGAVAPPPQSSSRPARKAAPPRK